MNGCNCRGALSFRKANPPNKQVVSQSTELPIRSYLLGAIKLTAIFCKQTLFILSPANSLNEHCPPKEQSNSHSAALIALALSFAEGLWALMKHSRLILSDGSCLHFSHSRVKKRKSLLFTQLSQQPWVPQLSRTMCYGRWKDEFRWERCRKSIGCSLKGWLMSSPRV